MSWDISISIPGRTMCALQDYLHTHDSDEHQRALVTIDALLDLRWESEPVALAVGRLLGWDEHYWPSGHRHDWLDDLSSNLTYNVGPMLMIAGIAMRDFNNMPCAKAAPKLAAAVATMEATPGEFKKLNPENGWGDYDGALRTLREMANWCASYPDGALGVH